MRNSILLGVTECVLWGLGLDLGHGETGFGQAGEERIPGRGPRLGDETLEAGFHDLCEDV